MTDRVQYREGTLATTFGIVFYFLFLRVIRCFSSPGSPDITIVSLYRNAILLALSSLIRTSVITFVYVQLVTAFRSLSRPSSAPYTKASSLRSLQLILILHKFSSLILLLALKKIQKQTVFLLTSLYILYVLTLNLLKKIFVFLPFLYFLI